MGHSHELPDEADNPQAGVPGGVARHGNSGQGSASVLSAMRRQRGTDREDVPGVERLAPPDATAPE